MLFLGLEKTIFILVKVTRGIAMSFEIKSKCSVGSRLKKILKEQTTKIIEEIAKNKDLQRKSIHQLRRRSKKGRAVFKLIRPSITPECYRKGFGDFRKIAQITSDLRDADVLIATFNALQKECSIEINHAIFDDISHVLIQHHQVSQKHPKGDSEFILNQLHQVLEDLEELTIKGEGRETIESGLKKTYGLGRERFEEASTLSSATRLHEWRKQVRYLGFQLKLLRLIHPKVEKISHQVNGLASVLGAHHDLTNLRDFLVRYSFGNRDNAAFYLLLDRIDHQSSVLEHKALLIGKSLYEDPPKNFRDKFKKRWDAWQPS